MGVKTTLSILRFEFHALGATLIVGAIVVFMAYLFGEWKQDLAVLASFFIVVFLMSLVRIDLGLAVLIIGMLFSPESTIGEAGRRQITLRAEDVLILALALAWVVRTVLLGESWKETPLNLPIIAFMISVTVSTVGGIALGWINPKEAIFYVGKLAEFFAVYFFTIHFIKDERQIVFFLGLFLAVGVAVSLYGLAQVGEVRRITAPFEGNQPEPNTFGGYLMTIIALAVPLAILCPSVPLRLLFLAVAGLAFSALLFTLSRASFLGLMGMFIVLTFLTRSKVLLVALVLFVLVHPYFLPEEVMNRVNYTFKSPSSKAVELPVTIPFVGKQIEVDTSTHERIDIWRKVLYTWTFNAYYFFFGWGVTRNQILDSQFARFLVEIGLVGVTLFTWILLRIFRTSRWLMVHAEDWLVKGFAMGYLACFIGILIHSLGTITFYIVRIMEPFWFLTGILVWWYLAERKAESPGVLREQPEVVEIDQPYLPWRQVDA